MAGLMQLSAQQLDDWREHPVTEALQEAMASLIEAQAESIRQSYYRGRAVPEPERLALLRVEEWVTDFFTATLDDMQRTMEQIDEHERNPLL